MQARLTYAYRIFAVVAVLLVGWSTSAAADGADQSNVGGNHDISNPNSPGWYSGYVSKGSYRHLRLINDRLYYGAPEVISLNEMCVSQTVTMSNLLQAAWPGQYHWVWADSYPGGGAPGGDCVYTFPGGSWSGFGNFLITKSTGYTPWVAGGVVNMSPPWSSGVEYKTWACIDGGANSARFTACASHFWPHDIRAGFACAALPWLRDNAINPFYYRHLNEIVLGDLYLTRNSNSYAAVDGTINGCTPPGLLTWWRSNFATGSGPDDNSQTLGIHNARSTTLLSTTVITTI